MINIYLSEDDELNRKLCFFLVIYIDKEIENHDLLQALYVGMSHIICSCEQSRYFTHRKTKPAF